MKHVFNTLTNENYVLMILYLLFYNETSECKQMNIIPNILKYVCLLNEVSLQYFNCILFYNMYTNYGVL